MTAKPSPPRIPKGSKEGGRLPPKWASGLRDHISNLQSMFWGCSNEVHGLSIQEQQDGVLLRLKRAEQGLADLSSRLGTSTPLIIWNIAVLIAIAGLGVAVAKLYGVAP